MKLGAHVRTAGGVDKAVDRAEEMGAETIQVFSGAPQAWRRKNYSKEEVTAFKARLKETGIGPVFIHGLYLMNFGTDNPELLKKSQEALIAEMNSASLIGARGVIFHLGSHKGAGYEARVGQVVDQCRQVLDATPGDAWLILENAAGQGGAIGSKFAELGRIAQESGSDRVKICLDTQHTFAAGYDVKTREGLDATMAEFDKEIGLDRLAAVHANDSKIELGGSRDRHENIGEGFIGRDGFENLLSHAAFADVPFLLEVPGFDDSGPDKANVDILKELRAAAS
ncbi:MAG: deoxyribonuclease IV [Chloroflexi bacterium]|nr:deoxyribonuclease IV [Chloroflexota bacterium]MCI0819777.1 deoxyribonuclease IV [Chloroflexota bacterium]